VTPELPLADPSIVVDASVALKWLLPEPGSPEALALLAGGSRLLAPALLPIEVVNVLWKRVRAKEIRAEKAAELMEWLLDAPLELRAAEDLLPAALQIAVRYDRTVYDSLYVALAVSERAVLVTCDLKLRDALAGSPLAAFIRLPGDGL
jgi:predicted nucleic acid-binding protein